jgi:hypothetical protein
MNYVIKVQIASRGMNNSLTNMINSYICSVCCLDLTIAMISIMYNQLVQFSSDMIGSTCVGELI